MVLASGETGPGETVDKYSFLFDFSGRVCAELSFVLFLHVRQDPAVKLGLELALWEGFRPLNFLNIQVFSSSQVSLSK